MHAIMEFFGTIGKFVSGSGFEDIVYQAGLCTSGTIKGVLAGKHLNRSWLVHEAFSEAMDRLFIDAYVPQLLEGMGNIIQQKGPVDAAQGISKIWEF